MPQLEFYLCRLSYPSALSLIAIEPGSISRSNEVRKNHKYEGLCNRYIIEQSILNSLVCLDEIQTLSFPDWVT